MKPCFISTTQLFLVTFQSMIFVVSHFHKIPISVIVFWFVPGQERHSQVSLPQVSRLSEPRPWSGETV